MRSHAQASHPETPETEQDRPKRQEDGQVDVVEAKLVGPAEASDQDSPLSPGPTDYSVEVSFQSPITKAPPPPVALQPSAPARASQLQSEKVVIAAPMSFAGSAARIWKLVRMSDETWARVLLAVLAVFLIAIAWVIVLGWYLIFGIFLIPYRLIRRGSRKRKREALQHREMIAAIQGQRPPESHD